ncbi:MAG: hypothetical protein RLZZ414_2304, partial [Bacteroidota bacterium]
FNGNYEVIANYIDELRDATFDTGADLFSTFFITNDNFGTIDDFGVTIPTTGINIDDIRVDVLEVRKKEFRQLLLKLKPTQTVGYLFVNYV